MSVNVNAAETAIVVVDMQEIEYEYISREDEDEFFLPQRAINELLKKARSAHLAVLHVAYGLRISSTLPISIDICSPNFNNISPWHKDSYPEAGDFWMMKNSYSIFHAGGLQDVIASIRDGCKTVILTGVQTAVCIKETAMHAKKLGYQLIIPRDTTGDMYRDRKIDALNTFLHCGVHVCNSDEIIFE